MNNLFKGAKFGDKFITRDGKIAIFSRVTTTGHVIYFDELENRYMVLSDGRKYDFVETEIDIVSRYKEPIDEWKLDKLAKEEGDDYGLLFADVSHHCELNRREGFIDGFKAGYKAGVIWMQ